MSMLEKGAAKKVTIFINEDTRHHLGSLTDAILNFLLHKGVAGATATRALAGFGGHRVIHTRKIEVLAEHLGVRIEFIESAAKVRWVTMRTIVWAWLLTIPATALCAAGSMLLIRFILKV